MHKYTYDCHRSPKVGLIGKANCRKSVQQGDLVNTWKLLRRSHDCMFCQSFLINLIFHFVSEVCRCKLTCRSLLREYRVTDGWMNRWMDGWKVCQTFHLNWTHWSYKWCSGLPRPVHFVTKWRPQLSFSYSSMAEYRPASHQFSTSWQCRIQHHVVCAKTKIPSASEGLLRDHFKIATKMYGTEMDGVKCFYRK